MSQGESVLELERSVLGGMLRDNGVIGDVVQVLREDDLTGDHPLVFRVIVDLWDSGHPADTVSVADELHRRCPQVFASGYRWIGELWDVNPTAVHTVRHARRVHEWAVLRRLAQAGREIARLAEEPDGPAEQVLGAAERTLFAIADIGLQGSVVSLEAVMQEAAERLDTLTSPEGGGPAGLPTGFRDLDALLVGLQPSDLVILAARPSCGKTALGLAITHNVAMLGRPVLFASLEQGRVDLATRLLCSRASVDSQRLRKGLLDRDEVRRLADARDALRRYPVHIDDGSCQGMLRIAANARRLSRRGGLALVVVDYLQLVEPDSRKDPRHEQVAGISRRLKALARELNVPVLALAQLNRGVEERSGQRPRLSDLRESGSLEQDADVVLLMHRPAEQPPGPCGQIEVLVAKQRNGPTGELALRYNRPFMRFEDVLADVGPDAVFPE